MMQDCIHYEACERQAHFWVAVHGDIFSKTCNKSCPVYESKNLDTCYLARISATEYKRTGDIECLECAPLDAILRSVSPWRQDAYLENLGGQDK